MNLTERLKLLVAEDGRDQKFIAKDVGISEGALTNYLQGRTPRLAEVRKLADFFKLPLNDLLGFKESDGDLRARFGGMAVLSEGIPGTPEDRQRFFDVLSETLAKLDGFLHNANESIAAATLARHALEQEIKRLTPITSKYPPPAKSQPNSQFDALTKGNVEAAVAEQREMERERDHRRSSTKPKH